MTKLTKLSPRTIAFHVVMIGVGLTNLVPLYYMITGALRDPVRFSPSDIGVPLPPHWENLSNLFIKFNFAIFFRNTLLLTVGSVILSLLVSIPAAYAFSQSRGRLSVFSFNIIAALMAVPPIVVAVPLFVQMAAFRLINTFVAPIVVYVGFLLPFSILMLESYFRSLPQELLEAARVEGASELGVIRRVVVPLTGPPLVSLALINGFWVWNELLIASLFLQQEDLRTLSTGIALFTTRESSDLALQLAGSLVATLPLVVAYVFAQRAFARGIISGAFR